MMEVKTFDKIWEDKYSSGHSQRYPWDIVVSFVYRHYPRSKARGEIEILEVGCGTASNLWFAAREGFKVTGIDASPSAIAYAKKRFSEEGLSGEFEIGDFSSLPFESGRYDLVIDRAAITCCGLTAARRVVEEVRRVLITGGVFLFNPYSKNHDSYRAGRRIEDGLTVDISAGTLVDFGQICFYERSDIDTLFQKDWEHISLKHVEIREEMEQEHPVHAEWQVITKKL
jgi:SAM-dependent methyltransferase